MLDEAGVSYYNPQVDEWHEGLMDLEAQAKETGATTRPVAIHALCITFSSSHHGVVCH